jgi:spore germination cell wall hydrolase CwlJ-like protein
MHHRSPHVRWICASLARWALGAGLLVSFTATAGIDPQAGVSAAYLSQGKILLDVGALVPRSTGFTAATSPARSGFGGLLREASLTFDLPREAEALTPGTPPRSDLKQNAPGYPEVERTRKGDPLAEVRPTLSRRAAQLADHRSRVLFRPDERALPPTLIMLGPVQGPDAETMNSLEPWHADDTTLTTRATSVQSPAAAAAGSTGSGRGATTPTSGGSTPVVPRAVALSSATPAPADASPMEIAAAPVSIAGRAGMTTVTRAPEQPRYADLIKPDHIAREQRCLSEAVYFEARSEPEEGQAAVAQVILNRVKSGLYPSTICGVVYQNRHRHLACQFTFACEGKALRVSDNDSWERARRVAREVLEGRTYLADVGGATHYHADYVRPSWSRRLKKMDVIGRHIFYKLKPGQT